MMVISLQLDDSEQVTCYITFHYITLVRGMMNMRHDSVGQGGMRYDSVGQGGMRHDSVRHWHCTIDFNSFWKSSQFFPISQEDQLKNLNPL